MTARFLKRSRKDHAAATSLDRAFDELVPSEWRHLSQVHWTPVEVAARVAALLCPGPDTRVLDVGSGIGKLCSVGALSEVGIWCGVEQHGPLVDAAKRIARQLGVAGRTEFLHRDAFAIDWHGFDAFYLFNPFEYPLTSAGVSPESIDCDSQVAHVRERLSALRRGTRVVTLHGIGGAMPRSFNLVYHERVPPHGLDLALWVKTASAGATPS